MQNYCVRLRNQARKAYFNKLQNTYVDKKKFWKTIGPFLPQKSNKQSKKIILKEQNELVSEERKVEEIFRDYFSNITETINVPNYDPPDKA